MDLARCFCGVILAAVPACTRQGARTAEAPPDGMDAPAATSSLGAQAPSGEAGIPAAQECAGEPCCGDPPRPCGAWLAEQRARNGAIVVMQAPTAECTVFLDGQEWPEGRTFRAFRFVAPGRHTIECRSTAGVISGRTVDVEPGQDTPVYWGP